MTPASRWRHFLSFTASATLRQLLLLGAVLLALIWGVVLWEADRIEQQRMADFRSSLTHLSEVIDETLVRQLREIDNALLILRSEYVENKPNLMHTLHLLRQGPLKNLAVQVLVINRDGYSEMSDASPQSAPVNMADRQHFRFFAEGGPDQLYIGDPVLARITKGWGIPLVRPILDRNGQFLGVISIFTPPDQLTRFMQWLDVGTDTVMAIFSTRGVMLSRSKDLDRLLGTRLNPEQLAEYQDSRKSNFVLRHVALDQIERGIAYRQLSAYPLLLAVSRSPTLIYQEIAASRQLLIALGIGVTLIIGGVLLLLGLSLRRREQAEVDLRIAATAFESQEGMFVTDAHRMILRVNRSFTAITGYTAGEAIGNDPSMLSSGRHGAAFYDVMWESIQHIGSWQGEIWDRRKNGEIYPAWLTITAVKAGQGAATHYVATLTDITARKAAEAEILNLAFFDPLTLLPNRRLLLDRLQQALVASARSKNHGALLFIDLDDFKPLNDTLGHSVGDLLLQQVAQRLATCVREGDTVSRLGGDEFVVMLENLSEASQEAIMQTEAVGEKILTTMNQPYYLDGHEHRSTASIGVTLFCDQQTAADELLKRADLAMYQAKSAGRNTLRFFTPDMPVAVTAHAAPGAV